MEGFCPSFVTVHGGRPQKAQSASATFAPGLSTVRPLPPRWRLDQPYRILVAGIGGTGVITIGALLGMAAHLEGKGCAALDFTGLLQKNGAVMSHVRIAATPEEIPAVRVPAAAPTDSWLRHGGFSEPSSTVAATDHSVRARW